MSPRVWRRWTRCCSSPSGARPARNCGSGCAVRSSTRCWHLTTRRPPATTKSSSICSTAPPTSWPSASSGCATHSRASTRRPSPPHTSSASWFSNPLVWPVIPMPVFSWSKASTMWSPRSSTIYTWRTSGSRRTIRRSPATRRWTSPGRSSATRTPNCGRSTRRPASSPRSVSTSRKPCAPSWRRASANSASCTTTICCPDSRTRWRPTIRRLGHACSGAGPS